MEKCYCSNINEFIIHVALGEKDIDHEYTSSDVHEVEKYLYFLVEICKDKQYNTEMFSSLDGQSLTFQCTFKEE